MFFKNRNNKKKNKSKLVILEMITPTDPIHDHKSSLLLSNTTTNSINTDPKNVTFSQVIIVNNLKTIYLMKNNHQPGTTKRIVNTAFQPNIT